VKLDLTRCHYFLVQSSVGRVSKYNISGWQVVKECHELSRPEVYIIFVNNMASIKRVDDSVKEYLLHRGLYASAKAVENELKTEKDKAFRVIH